MGKWDDRFEVDVDALALWFIFMAMLARSAPGGSRAS